MTKAILAALAVLALAASSALAQTSVTSPLLSLQRLNVGAGANYGWYENTEPGAPNLPFKHEWNVGIYGAYNLLSPLPGEKGTHLSLVGGTEYLWDNQMFYSRVGLRVTVFDGGGSR